jgi:hypothetical protein
MLRLVGLSQQGREVKIRYKLINPAKSVAARKLDESWRARESNPSCGRKFCSGNGVWLGRTRNRPDASIAYREYYRTGGPAVKFRASKEAFNEYPFRVLMVFKSEARRNNLAGSLLKLNPPILKQCWLTTLDEVTQNPLGQIWKKPEDSGSKRNSLL